MPPERKLTEGFFFFIVLFVIYSHRQLVRVRGCIQSRCCGDGIKREPLSSPSSKFAQHVGLETEQVGQKSGPSRQRASHCGRLVAKLKTRLSDSSRRLVFLWEVCILASCHACKATSTCVHRLLWTCFRFLWGVFERFEEENLLFILDAFPLAFAKTLVVGSWQRAEHSQHFNTAQSFHSTPFGTHAMRYNVITFSWRATSRSAKHNKTKNNPVTSDNVAVLM